MTLTSDLTKTHANRLSLNEEISNLKSEVQRWRREVGERDDQVRQLKALVEAIDKTRQELLMRVQESGSNIACYSDEKQSLLSENDIVRRELLQSHDKLSKVQSALSQLDRENDATQEKLDRKIELIKDTETSLTRARSEHSDVVCRLNDTLTSNEALNRKLIEKEQEIRELRSTMSALNREMGDARNMLESKARECKEKDEDLHLVTKENANTQNEFMRLDQERQQVTYEAKQLKLREGD